LKKVIWTLRLHR